MGRYSSELVGESNYQDAVRRLQVGDPIELVHEPDNAYDALAVKACDLSGRTVGYVPRGSWLQRLVAEDQTDAFALVRSVIGGEPGKPALGVVLDVFTAKDASEARLGRYGQDRPAPEAVARKSAVGQIIEHRAPIHEERAQPKGFFDRIASFCFGNDPEAERALRQARAERGARGGQAGGNGGRQTIYVKSGPNSFQSCMGCLGVAVLILILLMALPTPQS